MGERPPMIPPRGDKMLEVSDIEVIYRPPIIPPRGDKYIEVTKVWVITGTGNC